MTCYAWLCLATVTAITINVSFEVAVDSRGEVGARLHLVYVCVCLMLKSLLWLSYL